MKKWKMQLEQYSNEKGTKVEIIFESPYDVFEFKEILIKYEVIDKE